MEGALFRMHRYLLERESSYFRDVWSEDPLLGTSDDKAIILSGLTVQEFECLLHFMYYGYVFRSVSAEGTQSMVS